MYDPLPSLVKSTATTQQGATDGYSSNGISWVGSLGLGVPGGVDFALDGDPGLTESLSIGDCS